MLSLLHIENIAVIESADIQFDKGFNALTGETGAGKSIVVDAIGAIIGERTSRDLIRTGARSALVNAVFTGLPPLAWFQENGGGPDEDGNLLIQREIQPDGKNVCRLNGRLITVAQLRQLGRQLLNIHGQHDGQQLLDERCHLEYLDGSTTARSYWTRGDTWSIWMDSEKRDRCRRNTGRPLAALRSCAGRLRLSRWTRRRKPGALTVWSSRLPSWSGPD